MGENSRLVTEGDFEELKNRLKLIFDADPEQYQNDYALRRYLKAFKNVDLAFQQLLKTNKWRKEYGILTLSEDNPVIKNHLESKKAIVLKHRDIQGRPVIYINSKFHNVNERDIDQLTKFIVFCLEQACKKCFEEVSDNLCIIFDLNNFGLTSMDYQMIKNLIWLLTRHYPERLGICIIYNAPTIFQGCWSVIKGWLDENTVSKVVFVSSEIELCKYIIPESRSIRQFFGSELLALAVIIHSHRYPVPTHSSLSHTVAHKLTTEGSEVQGGASRALGGRDDIRSQRVTERWVPPSAIKRDALPENNDDVKFRKVRAILNKLTPQTFDRLSNELLTDVGLDTQSLIKGVILLIFEKALQEPKYVSMYAQLCKKLSKKVPNFDPPNPERTTTFRRLLLNKCQDEYINRTRASAFYDQRTEHLTPEEEEEKILAKRKMLGNIKFIGELGKLEMLTHSILHRCCEELVKKTKAEDLECLCQIMSTCGRLLDNDRGKYLMDQYFTRIEELSKSDKLPPRIRFMLQDVVELRGNNWLPKLSGSVKESPKPIEDIRREAYDELGIMESSAHEDFKFAGMDSRRTRAFMTKKMTGMEDVFAAIPVGVTSLGTGPGVITAGEKSHVIDSNGYGSSMPNYRPSLGMRGFNHQANGQKMSNSYYQKGSKGNHVPKLEQYPPNQTRINQNSLVNNGYEKTHVAPRFRKGHNQGPILNGNSQIVSQTSSQEELSLRPPPNSMMKIFPPPTSKSSHMFGTSSVFVDPIKPQLPKVITTSPKNVISPKEAILVKTAKDTLEKMKITRDKGPTKEEILRKLPILVDEYCQNKDMKDAVESFREFKVPDKLVAEMLTVILNKAMDRTENERELIYNLLLHLVEVEAVASGQFRESFRNILDLMADMEADIPRIKSYVAAYVARAVSQGTLSLAEVGEATDNGNHYPFLLLVLQQMSKSAEKTKLCRMFEESKIQLLGTLPKADRTKDRMADILEERELSFLFPLLKIQAEMTKQLQEIPTPEALENWINVKVDSTYHSSHGFISALMAVVFKFIIQEVSQNQENEQSDKVVRDMERQLLTKFKPLLSKYLQDRIELHVIAIYALQGAWFAMDCPKVMLLRWFVNLYELEMIEEEAFLKWKEDIRDDYPGKGKALFQVNQWLLWLEQMEDEEDAEEDQDA